MHLVREGLERGSRVIIIHYKGQPSGSSGLLSPFELIYDHEVRGPLKVLKESWASDYEMGQKPLTAYVQSFKEKLAHAVETAHKNMKCAQRKMENNYDKIHRVVDRVQSG